MSIASLLMAVFQSELLIETRTVLSLCDYSGNWSQPYRDTGYKVVQVDLKRGQDVRTLKHLGSSVHGILAAPPCTHFASSGARWWKDKDKKPEILLEALATVDACLRAVAIYNPVWWVLENPVGRLKDFIGAYTESFDPCEYAGYLDPSEQDSEQYTKNTCLWGRFTMPPKKPLEPIHGSKMWSQYGGKSERTKTMRSMTPKGYSKAFHKYNQ